MVGRPVEPQAAEGVPGAMPDQEKRPPHLRADGMRRAEDRQDRQARALRENLLKRKAQQRERKAQQQGGPGLAAPEAGEDAEP